MILYPDAHTHLQSRNSNEFTLLNVCLPTEKELQDHCFYSAGIHPWTDPEEWERGLTQLKRCAFFPQVRAIGECGLDKLHGASLDKQRDLFFSQVEIADNCGKPLIIHNVRANQEIFEIYGKSKSHVPWVLHGFRGNVFELRMFLRRNFFFSYGLHFNKEALYETPLNRLLLESDENAEDGLPELYRQVAMIKGVGEKALLAEIRKNMHALFLM
ncbi:MAG: TatD family hydrolase [Bacteroidales bacterium]|nr:TatD family hydrolase [Bacteroidales bacterium]